MKLIVTDTYDQINGVSTTYKNILKLSDGDWTVIHPSLFKWTSFSVYPEVQICTEPYKVWKKLKDLSPTRIHIATEGVMGLVAHFYCEQYKVPYTTAYHTKFPDFLKELAHIPEWMTWMFLRWFHRNSMVMMTTTETMCRELEAQGFMNAVSWTRGVDTDLLGEARDVKIERDKPILISVGRVSKEKNLDVFCRLDASKYHLQVVGGGPYLDELKSKYPHVEFLGYKQGLDLGSAYANADCMVFTSLTDTFGLVMIESMCMGTPVAAFPVTGPTDAITQGVTGFYNDNLENAIQQSLQLDRCSVTKQARTIWNWQYAYDIFNSYSGC